MYKHLIEAELAAGKKVKRLSWPEGTYVVKLDGSVVLTDEQRKAAGLKKNTSVSEGEVYLHRSGKNTATAGYVFTGEDKGAQDWELAEAEEVKDEEPAA